MIKQVIDLWRRPLKPSPTPSSALAIDDRSTGLVSSGAKLSFGRDSLGADEQPVESINPADYIALEIQDLISRITILTFKIDELYRRPRMPYTQGHSQNEVLKLISDGNTQPDWASSIAPTNPSATVPTGTFVTPSGATITFITPSVPLSLTLPTTPLTNTFPGPTDPDPT